MDQNQIQSLILNSTTIYIWSNSRWKYGERLPYRVTLYRDQHGDYFLIAKGGTFYCYSNPKYISHASAIRFISQYGNDHESGLGYTYSEAVNILEGLETKASGEPSFAWPNLGEFTEG